MESEEKEGIETCPTCGSHVPVYISPEGTGSFVPIDIEVIRERISSLEAALSLSPENVERVVKGILHVYLNPGESWEGLSENMKRGATVGSIETIKAIRKLAGLEVSDGE